MNKVALVTGGTSGIGKGIVKELLNKGCKVVNCYHDNDKIAELAKDEFNNKNLMIIKCDVSNEKEVIAMFNKIRNEIGKIDYLVNNAGTFIDSMIKDFDISILADKSISKEELINILEQFYPKEKQNQYGVLGIRFELI